jgi:hypothetical protein
LKELAPIAVSTYSRINHLRRTIEALKKNTLAKESELYVFSDAPKVGDEDKVAEVRRYLHGIQGFKNVTIFEREMNDRVKNNRGGIKDVLEIHGRIIFLEEDVVSAPGFLQFMNDALQKYEHEKQVFSITGWCPKFRGAFPLAKGSTFFVPRFAGWGFGIWRDRFEKIKAINVDDLKHLEGSQVALDRITHQMGHDVLPMIRNEAHGGTNALDIRCCFHQAITGELTLYPYPSLTRNIGLDGTGEHCGFMLEDVNGPLDNSVEAYQWPRDISVNDDVAALYADSFRQPLRSRLANRIVNKAIRLWNKA